MLKLRMIFLGLVSGIFCSLYLFATSPHPITLDGNMNEWEDDEIVWLDSQNDSPWGSFNELYKLGVTWDDNYFYFGLGAVLTSGNHLIVYIATGTSGISSAFDLRSPEDINKRWYWAKNNNFPVDFLPAFQWHSYQTEFKGTSSGQGLFRYVYNSGLWQAKPETFFQSPPNPDSDGNVYREVEVKIPWTVFYGARPVSGQIIKLVVAICGGTDESLEYYGSAHEAMPDQTNSFPSVWYDTYTFTSYLSIVYDDGSNRSPISRNLTVQTSGDQAKITWDRRGARESGTYLVYYSTAENLVKNLQSENRETAENELYLKNLIRNVTYYVTVSKKYSNSRSEIKSFILKGPLIFHQPVFAFSYPGKKCHLQFFSEKQLSTFRLGWRSGNWSNFQEVDLLSSGNTYYYDLDVPENSPTLDYYFVVGDSESTTVYPAIDDYYSVSISSVWVKEWDGKLIIPDEYNDTSFSSYLSGGEFFGGDIFRIKTFGFNDLSSQEISSLPAGLELVQGYEISLQRGEKIYLSYPLNSRATLVLRHLSDSAIDQLSLWFFDGRYWQKLPSSSSDNRRLRAEITSLGKFGIFRGSSSENSEEQKILRIAHSVFAPGQGEFLEFIFTYNPAVIKLNVYDTRGRRIYSGNKAIWNGRDNSGQIVEGGLYIYQLDYDGKKLTGSCVVLR